MTDIPIGNPGVAAGVTTENFKQFPWLLSNTPALFVTEHDVEHVSARTPIEFLQVVGINAAGRVIVPTNIDASNAAGAKGIAAFRVVPTASGAFAKIQIYRAGHFNIDMLRYPEALFDNEAKKLAAFNDAPNPGNIILGVNKYHRKT